MSKRGTVTRMWVVEMACTRKTFNDMCHDTHDTGQHSLPVRGWGVGL